MRDQLLLTQSSKTLFSFLVLDFDLGIELNQLRRHAQLFSASLIADLYCQLSFSSRRFRNHLQRQGEGSRRFIKLCLNTEVFIKSSLWLRRVNRTRHFERLIGSQADACRLWALRHFFG